jgi:Tfp pilus assembly protein PilV
MIAMVILAIALLGLAGLQIVSVRGNSLASQITEATTIAQDQLEQLIATPFATLVGLGTVANNVTRKGVTYNVHYTVTPDPGGTRADVDVTIAWTQDTNHAVTISSVICQY